MSFVGSRPELGRQVEEFARGQVPGAVDDFVVRECIEIPSDSTRIHNPLIPRDLDSRQRPADYETIEILSFKQDP